ncbi:MAG: prepilin-type N-terminal cleavage/methylation domain-containing protein [Planctomycetaceae bacterium]|nr:prepilin-type N-terminal cleavage/methylation domain-containing protein [Planctomycetaceae bacterium]
MNPNTRRHSDAAITDKRSGFTMVELLIAVSILLVLAGITVSTLNYSAEKEKISNGTRDMQSYLKGARDRAIFRRSPTGVRLVLDDNGPTNNAGNPITVSSMVYIGSPEPFVGQLSIDMSGSQRNLILITTGADGEPGMAGVDDNGMGVDDDGDMMIDEADEVDDHTNELLSQAPSATDDVDVSSEWNRLENLGLLSVGVEIELTPSGGNTLTFTLQKNPSPIGIYDEWRLTSAYPGGANINNYVDVAFRIELRPAVLPNQQSRELPKGVVLDLEACRRAGTIPANWSAQDPSNPTPVFGGQNNRVYSRYMDIMFSPRGVGFGQWASEGQIQLLFVDSADVEKTTYNSVMYNYTTRDEVGRERVISINAQSGNISMTSLNLTDGDSNSILDDPFLYAETGVRAP